MSLSRKYTWCPSEPVCPRTLPTRSNASDCSGQDSCKTHSAVQCRQKDKHDEPYTKILSIRQFHLTDTHMFIPCTVSDRRKKRPCHKTGRVRRDDEVQQNLRLREVQKCWSAGASQEPAVVETWAKTGGCSYVVLKNTGWSKLAREGDNWKAIKATKKTASPRKAGISWQLRDCLLLELLAA